ncbi:hypothetical protein Acr_23g0015770 [Actinidia rufa]|uniref:Uncharacterized protein n=1 Tax=Actinidia rufa TaxID=165716 RepID=A0A7J0GQX0_9ERIC|nr:hypothetical protein Acr_23g0015770 [Actinidia rufa]
MILKIGEGFLPLDTAKYIWDTAFETYSKRGNIAQLFDLHQCVDRLDQAKMTSLQYYYTITTLWFLAGLRDKYDQVQCRILNIDPVPSLREAFAIIQNEESHRGVMVPPIPYDRSALVSVLQSECRRQPTHRDSGPSVVVMIKISYIMITASDLITLGRLTGSPRSTSFSRTRLSFKLCRWPWW